MRGLTDSDRKLGGGLIGGLLLLAIALFVLSENLGAGVDSGPALRAAALGLLAGAASAAVALVLTLRRRDGNTGAGLEHLLAGLPVLVYRAELAPDGCFARGLCLSRNTLTAVGWPPEALATRADWLDRVHPDDSDTHSCWPCLLRGETAALEYRFRRPDGSYARLRDLVRVAARLPDGGAEVIGAVMDVSEAHALAAREIGAARLAGLGELATMIGHELAQPLTAIALLAEATARELESAPGDITELRALLADLAGQVTRAAGLTRALRRFARPEDGDDLAPVVLAEAVHGAFMLAEPALRDAGVAVEIDVPGNLPPVLGRRTPIEQVVLNLMLNARDTLAAMPLGARRLRIAAQVTGEHVGLTVTNTGNRDDGAMVTVTLLQAAMPIVPAYSQCAGTQRQVPSSLAQ